MSSLFATYAGSTLYLDTIAFYVFLRSSDKMVRHLFMQLKAGEIRAYTSVLTFEELARRMTSALIHDKYGDDCSFANLGLDKSKLIAEFYPQLMPTLVRLRSFPNLTLLDITAVDLMLMDENVGRYHFLPRDALHLAAMQKSGCFDLLSHNANFDSVPEINRYTLV